MLWPTNDDVVPFLKGNKRYYAVIKGNRIGNQELLVVFFCTGRTISIAQSNIWENSCRSFTMNFGVFNAGDKVN